MVSAQKPSVIPSLSRDLGTASKEKIQRLSNRSAKMLRLRTSCFAQNDKLGKLLTPHSSLLTFFMPPCNESPFFRIYLQNQPGR